jgi:predicted peptidase
LAEGDLVAEPKPKLSAASTFTIGFPEMPPTFRALMHPEQKETAQMTVFLPSNYSAERKYPLLVFLNGGDGGNGSNPGVARALSEDKDFVCLSVPLFRTGDPTANGNFVVRQADGKTMWPYFRTMLAKLDTLVANIDPAHQILGGFSNGAHATAALIDGSDGEITKRFSAFLFVEGGGHLEHYDQLTGKPLLMVASSAKSKPRAEEILNTAKDAGALGTFVFQDAGGHDFPKTAYPAVREWLRGAAHVDGQRALTPAGPFQ